jgi:hypothetical protein
VGSVLPRAVRLSTAIVIVMAGAVIAGCTVLGGDGLPGAAPACSWPLRVAGHATAVLAAHPGDAGGHAGGKLTHGCRADRGK